jgi:pimeloyl-ACP methyl ester carboxylesterase
VSAINAVVGDLLRGSDSDLAITMSFRRAGNDLRPTPAALRRAFPDAGRSVVVFLHGLSANEEWWLRGSGRRKGIESLPFGARLQADLGITPVYVRYNTGLHVSENGVELDRLLEQLVAHWPVPLQDLVLIGHSMGGLAARSAYHAARSAQPEHRWHRRLRHVVTLGTPHTGAPLEKAVRAASWALRRVPESAPWAEILDHRSAGIRDLRHGYLLEDEWRGEDSDRLFDDRRTDVPLLEGCAHTFITATVTRDPDNPIGWIAGDLLVRTDSAGGRHRTRSIPLPPESIVHLGPLTHFDLLDNPEVYARVQAALKNADAAQGKALGR